MPGLPGVPGEPEPLVKVVAEDNTFDTDCLEAQANRKFRIYLENRDSAPHNISIYSGDPSKDEKAEPVYEGKPVKGPGQEEYALDGMPPGKYVFRCAKVDAMSGTLLIPEPKKK